MKYVVSVKSQFEIDLVSNTLKKHDYFCVYDCRRYDHQCNYIYFGDVEDFCLLANLNNIKRIVIFRNNKDLEDKLLITISEFLHLVQLTRKPEGQSKSKNTLVELLTAGPGTKLKFITPQGTSPIIYTFIRLDYQNNQPIMICECEEYGKCTRYLADMGLIPYKGNTKTFWNPSNGIEIVA